MKVLIFLTALIVSAVSVSSVVLQQAHATSSDLKLVQDGSTYYVSTESDGNSVTTRKYLLVETATTAAESTPSGMTTVGDIPPTGYTPNIGSLISFLLRLVIIVALLLALLSLVMAGFEWITSGGDKGKVDGARNRIVAVLVGILILASSYALAMLVAYVLGFDSFAEVFASIKRINP